MKADSVAATLSRAAFVLFLFITACRQPRSSEDAARAEDGSTLRPLAEDACDFSDSAMVVTLAPGNYTAQVSGVGGAQGVALIEVYELP
jgi:hypothetical protein